MIRKIPLFLVAFLCAVEPTAAAGSTLPVFYTGRLLGYFRHPDRQTLCQQGCPADLPRSVQVEAFLQRLAQAGGGNPFDRLLVGVGDNFAPDFGARVIYRDLASQDVVHKDTLFYSHERRRWIDVLHEAFDEAATREARSGWSTVPADNVACFLRLAGYDALVPGKHDFYFGPERLREIARFLVSGEGHKVQLLAANLVISSSVANRAPRLPDYLKKLPYRTSGGGARPDLPAIVLPWLREIKVRNAFDLVAADGKKVVSLEELSPDARVLNVGQKSMIIQDGERRTYPIEWRFDRAYICRCSHQGDPASIVPPGGGGQDCWELERRENSLAGARPTTDVTYSLPGRSRPLEKFLAPGQSYGFCLTRKGQEPFCTPFGVHSPFFQYPLENINDWSAVPAPYATKRIGGEKVAVFGVVDPEFGEHIGELNRGWVNANRRWDTSLLVADPLRSLEQLLQFCELDEDCRGARKILLAQMPPEKAALLGVRLPKTFELVIAQADNQHATDAQTLTRRSATDSDFRPTFLVVPARMHQESRPDLLEVRIQKAALTRSASPPAGHVSEWSLDHTLSVGTVRLRQEVGAGRTLGELLDAALMKADHAVTAHSLAKWSSPDKFQRLVLAAMRKLHHADVAMLQRRDLYAPVYYAKTPVSAGELEHLLDRVFWKGDLVLRLEVTGSTLKGLMQRSRQFDQQDSSALNLTHETGRGLLPLGIIEDAETGQFLVNGQAVEDGRLYAIAVTDYIAHGDTGYPELQKPAVPPPKRLRDLGVLSRLSSLVCGAIAADPRAAGCGEQTLSAFDYLDETAQQPLDTTPGFTPWQRLRKWPSHGLRRPSPFGAAHPLEFGAQMRPVWSVALEKLEGSYGLYQHNRGTEANLSSKFAGVPVSQVTSPESTSLASSLRLRVTRAGRRLDAFLLAEESFARQLTRQSNNAYLQDQKANLLAGEFGVNARVWPMRKQVPDLKAILSLRIETQVARPITGFKLAAGDTLRGPTDRTRDVLGHLGWRYRNSQSWLEAGYQLGRRYAPVAYFFNGDPQQQCDLREAQRGKAFADCVRGDPRITADSKFQAVINPRFLHGAFLNFRIRLPLPVGVGPAYVMENRGDLFFNRNRAIDLAVDTRYLDLWTHSLVVPLLGNLSLVPKLEFFFYRNKRDGNSLRAMQTSLGLQYRFEWRRGLAWNKALRYPNPPPN